jgi:hypothetical protein
MSASPLGHVFLILNGLKMRDLRTSNGSRTDEMVIEMGHGKGQAFCPFGTLFSFDKAHNMGVRP